MRAMAGGAARIQGQALPEMVIVFPLVVILMMSVVQLALLYRAKATLNNATFLAARSGALNHGFIEPMRNVFLQRMAALAKIDPQRRDDGGSASFHAAPSAQGLLRMQRETVRYHDYPPLQLLSPSKALFNHFATPVNELERCAGTDCPSGGRFRLSSRRVLQIPNNNLDARRDDLQRIENRDVTLQDANLLSIRSRFCYALEVPVANFVIWRSYGALFGNDPDWALCQQQFPGQNAIPLKGHSLVRMQSPFRCEGDEENGVDCENI